MKKVLILGAPVFQIEIVKKAKEMGLYTGIVDVSEDAPALSYADEQFICSIRDYEGVLKIAREFKPDGVLIGVCDTSVVTGAKICEKLGLPGHSVDTSIKCTDKVKMLEAFQAKGVSHPKFYVVEKNRIDSFDEDIMYPVITKPVDSAGGRGVSIVYNQADLLNSMKYSSDAGLSGDILIEEYMKGPEVSVEMLVVDGNPYVLQITDKITSGEPYFYETGHCQPSQLPAEVKEQIKKLASKAVKAVGLINSPAHVEIIITDDGPKMVELGGRMGGDCITTYLTDTTVSGINMAKAAIEIALGEKPDVSSISQSKKAAAVRFIPAKKGILREIKGLEKAEGLENVIKVRLTGQKNKQYMDATDDSSRFGYVVAKGDSVEEAMDICNGAIKLLEFDVE